MATRGGRGENGFNRMLEQLRKRADGDGHTKGRLFERVVQSFLQTDSLYGDRFSDVWLWEEYPGRNKSTDIGADLVAKERGDGSLCAIQCKFYDSKTIQKADIDSFLEAGSRSDYSHMMLVYTGSSYGKNVESALRGHECKALNFKSLASSNVDWPDLARDIIKVKPRDPYKLRDYQQKAFGDVTQKFAGTDRGKLIMACGTGKTLVSLRIAEKMVGRGGLVLYAVPSISLMHQAIRYWSEQKTIPHGYVGVCSDPKVSHGDEKANIPIVEMELRVTTDPSQIKSALKTDDGKMTVVFSTYQSMGAVVEAQKMTDGKKFDLILCDEAHRTTGADRDSEQGSKLVHNTLKGDKRLYMTATPRIFKAAVKTKAADQSIPLYSMDDRSVYGDVLHELSFSDAIDSNLLSDYKVVVFGIDERYGSAALQKLVDTTTEAGDVNLTDAARMLGLYKALQNPDQGSGVRPMQTSIVYTNLVADSKMFAKTFGKLPLEENSKHKFRYEPRHVDGTQNATARADAIQWLRESTENPNECRILSNARCLSEGVDIPALDSICFMNPKESMVEIVQAVGRVMRKSENKKMGYVIIPIGIPPNEDANKILNSNKTYDTVWKILQALRSHDERMGIDCNTADLRKELPKRVSIFGVDRSGRVRKQDDKSGTIPIGELDVPSDMIFSKIVDEVGDRRYFEYWAKDVADVVARLQERIKVIIDKKDDVKIHKTFDAYIIGIREIINDQITEQEGIDMLAQHLITRRIFNAVFDTDNFAMKNPISKVLDNVIDNLLQYGLEAEFDNLESFYKSIENRVSKLDTHDARQPVISELYGTFFKEAFPRMASRLGIVYTPQEIVDFILHSVDHVSYANFGKGLTDKNVNIIDPFTGAGTFLVRLMSEELGLIKSKDLKYKYQNELFANEIVLLAYYIALVNCESIYVQRTGKFEQFNGASLTDTFSPGNLDEHNDDIMAEAKKQIRRQRNANITVVVGNPPYSKGQSVYDEQNPNTFYSNLDERIRNTYMRKTTTHDKKSLYDSYVRAIRWASDRIGKSGIIGFVTNGSFIKSGTMSGLRACLLQEFTDVYVFDLRGNQRTQGEISKREGGKVFGSGSRAPVAITILVRNPKKSTPATVHYRDIGDYHDRQTKMGIIKATRSIEDIKDWQIIKPDKYHDWLNQRSDEFDDYLPMGSKDAKAGKENAVFKTYSLGIATHRDTWVYNTSKVQLSKNVNTHINYYNLQDPNAPISNPRQASWSSDLTFSLKRHGKQKFEKDKIRISLYRPFFKQWLYFDNIFNSAQYQIPKKFPKIHSQNLIICVPDKGKNGMFSCLLTNMIPDLHIIEQSQCFSFYIYEKENRRENITDITLNDYQIHYKNNKITKFNIFYYVYGMLHHPKYRSNFKDNLTHELPRIPMAPDFKQFSKIGKKLADLHLSWETCPEYKQIKPKFKPKTFTKLSFATKNVVRQNKQKKMIDTSILRIDGVTLFDNVPEINYKINGRTPIEWAVDRYKLNSPDKDSGIIKDATKFDDKPIDIVSLIRRLVYVGVESDRLISQLPKEFEPKNWKPKKSGLDKFSE